MPEQAASCGDAEASCRCRKSHGRCLPTRPMTAAALRHDEVWQLREMAFSKLVSGMHAFNQFNLFGVSEISLPKHAVASASCRSP